MTTGRGMAVDGAALEGRVRERLAAAGGRYALYARPLGGEAPALAIDPEEPFYPCSVIKLPIMVEAFRQAHDRLISLEQALTMREADRVSGSGVLQLLSAGVALPVWDLIRLMICVSDNTATNMLIDLLGMAQLNRSFAAWGLSGTRLYNPLQVQPVNPAGRNITTAGDMGRLLELIGEGKVVSVWACERMAAILKQQQYNEEIPAGLPDRETAVVGGTPPVAVAHKTGWIPGYRHDAAIVYAYGRAYVLCLFGKEVADDAAARAAYRDISRLVFDAYTAGWRAGA